MEYMKLITQLFSTTCFIANCNSSRISEEQQEFNRQKALWSSKKIENYSYILDISCNSFPEEKKKIVVANNKIVDAIFIPSDTEIESGRKKYLKTIDDYFDIIQKALDRRDSNLTVLYNEEYGYPTYIYKEAEVAQEQAGYYLDKINIA
jgi:Zn-dependent peptidase ImmA (M78 family)